MSQGEKDRLAREAEKQRQEQEGQTRLDTTQADPQATTGRNRNSGSSVKHS